MEHELLIKIKEQLKRLEGIEDATVKDVVANIEDYMAKVEVKPEEPKTEEPEKVEESKVDEPEKVEEPEQIGEKQNEDMGKSQESIPKEETIEAESTEKTEEVKEEVTEEVKEEVVEEPKVVEQTATLNPEEALELAKWTRAYINSLPNGAFIIIEPAYLEGKTDNKNARHLPYKDREGNVDMDHLRNALARVNQIKPVTDSISREELVKKAMERLDAIKAKHMKQKEMKLYEQELSLEVTDKLKTAALELSRYDGELKAKDEIISAYKGKTLELEQEINTYKAEKALELKKRYDAKANRLIELYAKANMKKQMSDIENFSENQIDKLIIDLEAFGASLGKQARMTNVSANIELAKQKQEPKELDSKERAKLLFNI